MQFPVTFKDGRITNERGIRGFKSLEEGEYIVSFTKRYPKTTYDHHKIYRQKIKTLADHMGEKYPNAVHEKFKSDNGLASTADFDLDQWEHTHDLLQRWAYVNMDIIL